MKVAIVCFLLFLSSHTFANLTNAAGINSVVAPTFRFGIDANKKPAIYAFQGDVYTSITKSDYNLLVSSFFEDMVGTVCKFKVLPGSVTASVGFLSMSWDTEKLCSPSKK